jgi:hypothetical protein
LFVCLYVLFLFLFFLVAIKVKDPCNNSTDSELLLKEEWGI